MLNLSILKAQVTNKQYQQQILPQEYGVDRYYEEECWLNDGVINSEKYIIHMVISKTNIIP